jgi:hypothetical protein
VTPASARFRTTALQIGFSELAIERQWVVLAQVCGLLGVASADLTHAQVDAARATLTAVGRRYGRTRRAFRGGCFGLEATLFHAGITNQLPRRNTPDKATERARQWAELKVSAPTLTATVGRYLEQIALSIRPGTVRRHEAVLREFAWFVREREPDVTTAAAFARRHVEDYKVWLSSRPAQRGGPLHRHTIRERLGVVRVFFVRGMEWGWDDMPARLPVFAGDFPIPDQPLPRFLDDGAATKLLVATRADPDPFVRLCVEFLARTGYAPPATRHRPPGCGDTAMPRASVGMFPSTDCARRGTRRIPWPRRSPGGRGG